MRVNVRKPTSAVLRHRAGARERAATTGSERIVAASRQLVAVGLFSVMLGVPLAVLPEATGPYDDPKAWALVMLAMATGLAWLARGGAASLWALPVPDTRARAVRGVVLACLAWMVVTTIVSVAPLQSVLGNFGRGTGLLATGSAMLLFFVIQSECRSLEAVRALLDAILLGSAPVCLLALGQAAGWDPLPKPWDPAVASLTVRSTLGSHIFLGGYLVAVIPLTAVRLAWAVGQRAEFGRWPAPTRTQWGRTVTAGAWIVGAVSLIGLLPYWPLAAWALVPWGIVGAVARVSCARRDEGPRDTAVTTSFLAGLLAAQVLVVVLSRARGAFLAMVVGLGVTAVALLIRRRSWKMLAAVGLGLFGLAAFLVSLNLPRSPVASLGRITLLSRLNDMANVQHGSPGWFRLQVWRGIVDGWRRQLWGEDVFPGFSPYARSVIGFGLETQLLVLDPLTSRFHGVLPVRTATWQARYVADRAHNYVLDHLVTEGLVGAALYVLLAGTIVMVGIARIRKSGLAEATLRVGALGAVLAHLADGLVGIATSMSLVLFWLAAAISTGGSRTGPHTTSGSACPRTHGKPWWVLSLILATALASFAAWTETRWLLASLAYAEGARHARAWRMVAGHENFRRSVALAPWLPLPAEAAASSALSLAGVERDAGRRLSLLHEAEDTLARVRQHAMSGAGMWALTGQVALAEARAGERERLAASRDAFAAALRLRPGDPALLAQWGLVWLESGDAAEARRFARQALDRDPGEWLAWVVLARSARDLRDPAVAEEAAGKARVLAPVEARTAVDAMLR